VASLKEYPEHLPLERAREILCEAFPPIGTTEWVSVLECSGRILAEDLISPRNLPHFPASAVDGFAVRSSDVAGATPATPVGLNAEGEYLWVNTGSPVPEPFDAVVMVEDASETPEGILVARAPSPGANVRPVGEDLMAGQVVGQRGERITPSHAALFLAAGIGVLPVRPLPRTLYIPTGEEVVPAERWLTEIPRSGDVAESNSVFLRSQFREWGWPLDVAPIVPDDPERLRQVLREGAESYDLLLVGAGTAKGRRDHSARVLAENGRILFHWLRLKPGRPALAGAMGDRPVLCLPGFPTSTAVVLWELVLPLLRRLAGIDGTAERADSPSPFSGRLEARLLAPHSSPVGVEEILRVRLGRIDGTLWCWTLGAGASAMSATAEADGLISLSRETVEVPKGRPVEVRMLRRPQLDRRAVFQGSDDPAFQRLLGSIRRQGGDLVLRTTGSLGGVAALARGEAHLAACHLLDPESGRYNDSYLREFDPAGTWLRITAFRREQGILTAAGNPRRIRGIGDLAGGGVRFVNRQPGAGTRVLLDHLLRMEGVAPEQVRGYGTVALTHMEAANRIACGVADAALGIKAAADALGLSFIPLTEEPYELLIPREHENHPGIRALLSSLEDPQWRETVERMGGYRWP